MKTIRQFAARLRQKLTLTPQQADHLATIKFPCC